MNKKLIAFLLMVSCAIKSMETKKMLEEIIDTENASKLVKNIAIQKLLQLKMDAEEKHDLNKATVYFNLCKCITDAKENCSDNISIQITGLNSEELKIVPEGFMYKNNEKYYLNDNIVSAFSNYNEPDSN